MAAPPGRRSPGQAPRATATSTQQADEANLHPVTARRQDSDDAPGLFEAVVERNAYGREITFTVHDHVRGPGPRPPTTGPKDATATAWWWREAEQIVLNVVNAGGTICSDDLHDAFPEEPSASGAAFGGLFSRLAHEGRIVEVGMVKSRRPAAHRRRIVVWGRP